MQEETESDTSQHPMHQIHSFWNNSRSTEKYVIIILNKNPLTDKGNQFWTLEASLKDVKTFHVHPSPKQTRSLAVSVLYHSFPGLYKYNRMICNKRWWK